MDTLQPVESMTDDVLLRTFGTSEEPDRRGFDEATYARVLAYELVRARHRLDHYRTLYAAFVEAGQPFMVENLDDGGNEGGIPAKLIFSDDAGNLHDVEERLDVMIWNEPALLDALTLERALHDYLIQLLDELEPALQAA